MVTFVSEFASSLACVSLRGTKQSHYAYPSRRFTMITFVDEFASFLAMTQFAILWRVSQAVQHNFLMELGERLAIPYETKAEKELKNQLAENEKQIETLQTQLDVFKKIHKIE
jgi:hypothetical protein